MAFKLNEVQKTIAIPDDYNEEQRNQIGELIIKRIRTRCKSGVDLNGKSFKYTKGSDSAGNNLKESGDMLFSIDVINTKSGEITIGYPDDDVESRKAHGNTTGSYGDSTGHPSKAKPFLGVNKDELELILAQVEQPTTPEEQAKKEVTDSFIGNLFNTQGFFDTDDEDE